MLPKNSLLIAVDFDGTIVEDEYPRIGPAKIFAFDTLLEFRYPRRPLRLTRRSIRQPRRFNRRST